MNSAKSFCPPWAWWLRCGERLDLGLDPRNVLTPNDPLLKERERVGLQQVQQAMDGGATLVGGFRHSRLSLPDTLWTVLESGEQTGRLGGAIRRIGESLQERERRKRQLLGQLWYPLLVMGVGILVMGAILFWVIPEMRTVSTGFGLGNNLPWLTEHIGKLYGLLFAAVCGSGLLVIGLSIGLLWLSRRFLPCAIWRQQIIRHIPFLGRLVRTGREARLLAQLGILLDGGITLPGALGIAEASTKDLWLKDELRQFRESLIGGMGFASAVKGSCLVCPENVPVLEAGQDSGKLESFMLKLAEENRRHLSWQVDQLTRLLEPACLLLLSGAVGLLMLAYLLPMVRMLEQAGGFH